MGREEFEKYVVKLQELGSKLKIEKPKFEDIKLYLKYLAELLNFVLKNTHEIRQIKGAKYLQIQEKIYILGRIKDKELDDSFSSLISQHKKDIFPIIFANSTASISGLLIDKYS